jgi:hypothetical protein
MNSYECIKFGQILCFFFILNIVKKIDKKVSKSLLSFSSKSVYKLIRILMDYSVSLDY